MPLAETLIVLGGWVPGLPAIAVTKHQFRRWKVRPFWWVAALLGLAILGDRSGSDSLTNRPPIRCL